MVLSAYYTSTSGKWICVCQYYPSADVSAFPLHQTAPHSKITHIYICMRI